MSIVEAIFGKEFEKILLSNVSFASTVNSLEHRHRAELARQVEPLLYVYFDIQKIALRLEKLFVVLNKAVNEFAEEELEGIVVEASQLLIQIVLVT